MPEVLCTSSGRKNIFVSGLILNRKMKGGVISLTDLVKWFSMDYVRKRLDPDFFSNMQKYLGDWVNKFEDIGKTGNFWLP